MSNCEILSVLKSDKSINSTSMDKKKSSNRFLLTL